MKRGPTKGKKLTQKRGADHGSDAESAGRKGRQARRSSASAAVQGPDNGRLLSLFEQLSIGVVLTDASRRIVHCNSAFAAMLGYAVEELRGKAVGGITHEEDEGRNAALFSEALAAKRSGFRMEKRYVRKDGNTVWGDLTVSFMYSSEGKPDLILAMVRDVTGSKQAERALESALRTATDERTRSDAILAAIGDGVSIQDLDMKIVFQNRAVKELIGDHIGEYCYRAYERSDSICTGCPVVKTFRDGKVHTTERSVMTGSGPLHVEITASALRDAAGTIVAGVEIVRNVSERRQAEDILLLLKSAMESLPIGITITDLEGKVIYMNPAEEQIHGYAAQELIGRDSRILAPRENWNPIDFEQLHGRGVWLRESINRRKNGDVFPVELTSIAVKSLAGKPIGIVTACVDITERKKAEASLRESEERYRSFVQNYQGIAYRGRMDFVPFFFHGAVEQITGYKEQEFLAGQPRWDQVIHPDDLLRLGMVEEMRNQPGCSTEREYRIIRKDGRVRWIHELIQNISDSTGKPVMVQGSLYDVTERNLAEERLRNAQKMEVIGKLAAGVAHEVRNPLNAISALSDALAQDLGQHPEYREFLHHIRAQVDRLSVLMRDLLDLGKPVESSQMRVQPLLDICSGAVDIWKHSSRRSHSIILEAPPNAEKVMVAADSSRLHQVLLNLLENAAQHSPAEREIRMILGEDSGAHYRVTIRDRGSGVSGDVLPRLFEPFFSTRKGGVGLGMSIVKQIIESHGGTVAVVNNEPLPGCSVSVLLPLAEEKDP